MNQKARVLSYLQSDGPLTQKLAHEQIGVGRLSERVRELRKDGHEIESRRIDVTNQYGTSRVAEYRLTRHKDQGRMGL